MNCYIVGSVGALLIVVLPPEAVGYPATIRWAWVRLTTMDAIHFCAPLGLSQTGRSQGFIAPWGLSGLIPAWEREQVYYPFECAYNAILVLVLALQASDKPRLALGRP